MQDDNNPTTDAAAIIEVARKNSKRVTPTEKQLAAIVQLDEDAPVAKAIEALHALTTSTAYTRPASVATAASTGMTSSAEAGQELRDGRLAPQPVQSLDDLHDGDGADGEVADLRLVRGRPLPDRLALALEDLGENVRVDERSTHRSA